jgi:hypothetical protein
MTVEEARELGERTVRKVDMGSFDDLHTHKRCGQPISTRII